MSAFPSPVSALLPKNAQGLRNMIRRETADGLYEKDYNAFTNFPQLPAVGGVAAGKEPNFALTGTGTVPTPTLLPGGGTLIATRTGSAADNDAARLFPYATSTFGDPILPTPATGQQHIIEWQITTGASVVSKQIYAGIKLTDTEVIATDADQVLMLFDTDDTANFGPAGVGTITASANWLIVYSVGGTDVAVDTGIAVAASTDVRLTIIIAADRTARVYVNGQLKATTTALTSTASFKPAAGATSRVDLGGAKTLGARGCRVSRNFA